MKRIDGKDHYTFVGLINRLDCCKNRQPAPDLKGVPEKVVFNGDRYTLMNDKRTYINDRTYSSLAEDVAKKYCGDVTKYLTEFDILVEEPELVNVTGTEKSLIRYIELFSKDHADFVSIEVEDEYKLLYLWKDLGDGHYEPINSIFVISNAFCNFRICEKYRIQDLRMPFNG